MKFRLLTSIMIITTITIALIHVAVRAEPGTLYVDDDYTPSTPGWGIDHFDKIQDAANTAGDGDTINVYKGTYYESINVTEKDNLTFIAEKGGKTVKSVVIDADGNDGFWIRESNGVTISGFKIIDANNGIDTYLANYSSFINNHIEDCWQYGVYITGSHNKIVGNYLKNTSGIYCYIGGEMINNTISKNTILETEIWGISLHNAINCTITHNFILNASTGVDMSFYGGDCSGNVIMHNDISNVLRGIKFEPHVYSGLSYKMEYNVISRNHIHNITLLPGYGFGIEIQYFGGGVIENTHILHNTIEDADIGVKNHGNYGKVHHNTAINCITDYSDLGIANKDFKNSWNP